ncbi:MAG: ABC transporter substrate-binding protein, partial [Planctomycetota bacterium]
RKFGQCHDDQVGCPEHCQRSGRLVCLISLGSASRLYLASTTVDYDLDKRFLALELQNPYDDVTVLRSRREGINRPDKPLSTLQRIREEKILRVGYHPDRLPYSYFNAKDHLVGLDIELMHRLARELEIGIVFVPYQYDTLSLELESGEIDVALGGLPIVPERMLELGCTEPYQTATIAVVLPDHRRREVQAWRGEGVPDQVSFAVVTEDMARTVRRRVPTANVVVIDSVRDYFAGNHEQIDALVMPAESAAAWNILYPRHIVITPEPIMQRPVGMAVRLSDTQWLRFLDRWLEFEKLDGSIDELRVYWVQGGGTKEKPPRWCVLRDVLGWIP